MKRGALILACMLVAVALAGPVQARDRTRFDVGTGPGGIYAAGKATSELTQDVRTVGHTTLPAGHWVSTEMCEVGGLATCNRFGVCPDGTHRQDTYYETDTGSRLYEDTGCPVSATPPAQPVLTAGRVLEAFRRLPLPESPLLIEPSGGETIVNFDTIFYTTRAPFTRSVRLLGHRVRFNIEPSEFTWVWGDGQQRVTSSPGQPYRRGVSVDRDITHRYLTKDRFEPRLDTTYSATYSVDGRAARPVGGTVTIAGTPQELRTVTYTPLLVND